jgi:predicted TIM-barrel enzyme
MGLTTKGIIGAETAMTMEDAARAVTDITDAVKAVRDDVLVICHGGPIAEPEDARFIIDHCPGVDGFYGASSMERLPVEKALTDQVRKFCEIELPSK